MDKTDSLDVVNDGNKKCEMNGQTWSERMRRSDGSVDVTFLWISVQMLKKTAASINPIKKKPNELPDYKKTKTVTYGKWKTFIYNCQAMLSIHCTHFVFHISVSFINLSESGFVDVLQAKKTKRSHLSPAPLKVHVWPVLWLRKREMRSLLSNECNGMSIYSIIIFIHQIAVNRL